jgi:hypothetical protein
MKTFHTAANNGYIISKGSAGGNYTNTYFTKQNTLFSVGSTGGVKHQFSRQVKTRWMSASLAFRMLLAKIRKSSCKDRRFVS